MSGYSKEDLQKASQLVWCGARLPPVCGEGYQVTAFFGLGGESLYDYAVRANVWDIEIAQFGACILERRLEVMIEDIKSILYTAICNDRTILDARHARSDAQEAQQRAWAAEQRADQLAAKAAIALRLLKEVSDGEC